jgi:hypothetical protein
VSPQTPPLPAPPSPTIAIVVNPCSFGARVPGRQNAAEWIRTAFHDFITHDAAAGTGGLDASAAFEVDRPESNGGRALNNTFAFLNGFHNIRAPMADLLAMSVIVALFGCNGPKLPFRAGRVDATEAGPSGVPQPHEDLDTFLDRFRMAGLARQEMIGLVACGHTLGGVHSVDFPEITGGGHPDLSNDTVSAFDGTFAEFDNHVVTEYLSGASKNTLVANQNVTLNSDLRVFSSDGNKTMKGLSDPATFQSTCADLLGRMINTVPSTVHLTDPFEPPEVKPYVNPLSLNPSGNLTFQGQVRVRTTTGTGRNPEDLVVHLTFQDRGGTPSPRALASRRATYRGGFATGLYGENFLWFEFDAEVGVETGISRFFIHVTTPSTNETEFFDNGGDGYPVGDEILYLANESCLDTNIVDGEMGLAVVAAVRGDLEMDGLALNVVHRVPRRGVVVPALEEREVEFRPTGEVREGYKVYKAVTQLASESWSTTFDIVGGPGRRGVEFQFTNVISRENC